MSDMALGNPAMQMQPGQPAMPMGPPPGAPEMPMPPPGGVPPPPPPGPPPPVVLHDVTIVKRKTYGCAKVEAVPPEEFGVSRGTRILRDTNYCFHEVKKTEGELIEQGYDKAQVKAIPAYSGFEKDEESESRDTVEESDNTGDELNKSSRMLKVTEHYIRVDYEAEDKVGLWRVTTAGDQGEILKRDGKEDIVRVDSIPFAGWTPVIVPHRLIGRSMADLVMDIQKIKTALMRAMLDNAYLSNNPRPVVNEVMAGDTTLDDLLVWRPGAPIRTKQPGAIEWQVLPSIAPQVFPVMEYMDATREWRTGMSKQGQGLDANALQNQSATAVNQMFTASQARIRLIARVAAETGIRDLFSLLHETIKKNASEQSVVRLKNKWVPVDPRQWKTRTDMTINVGLGTGDKSAEFAKIIQLGNLQAKAAENPEYGLVTPDNFYNTAKQVTKLLGLKSVEPYFTDPKTNPTTGQKGPDPKQEEAKAKIELEKQKAQAQLQADQEKTQYQMQADQQKAQTDLQLNQAKADAEIQLQREKMQMEIQLKQEQMSAEFQLKRDEMMMEYQLKREIATMYPPLQPGAQVADVQMGGDVG